VLVFVLVPQPLDEHLHFRFVVGHEHVADAASADEVADFFGEVLGMVAGAPATTSVSSPAFSES